MAYISQDKKKELEPAIKAVLKEYGLKGSVAINHYSTLVVNIREGKINFLDKGETYRQVNTYHIESNYQGKARECLLKLKKAMSVGNYDNSDIMTDYFDVGWYININIGRYDKPYKCC